MKFKPFRKRKLLSKEHSRYIGKNKNTKIDSNLFLHSRFLSSGQPFRSLPVSQRIWTANGFRPPPPSPRPNPLTDMTPSLADLDPYQTFLLASFVLYLVSNSICKLFVDVLFNHNTTFLGKDKDKPPFRSNSAPYIIASRTVYASIKGVQTTAFELLKL